MSDRFKRASITLYLEPNQSIPDSYAFNTMIGWKKKSKALAADPTALIELHNLVHIHKNIYLSGLFLHSLKPALADSLAAALSPTTVNEAALLDILKLHEIRPEPVASMPFSAQEIDAQLLGNEIGDRLLKLLDTRAKEVSDPIAHDNDAFELLEQKLDGLIQAMSQHTETAIQAEGFDPKALTHEITASLDDKLSQVKGIAELQKLVKKQTTLIKQLFEQINLNGVAIEGGESNQDGALATEERLAKVQSIKKKGVF